MKVGNCSSCGKNAAWNTPTLDKEGNLRCDTCSNDSPILLQGVDQFLDKKGNYVKLPRFYKRGIVIWYTIETGQAGTAWFNNGGTSAPLNEDEVDLSLDPESLCDKLADEWEAGYRRCTSCKATITEEEIGGYPLFAGLNCESCWAKHVSGAKHDHICSMCRKPLRFCCC